MLLQDPSRQLQLLLFPEYHNAVPDKKSTKKAPEPKQPL